MSKDIKAAAERLIAREKTAYLGSLDADGFPSIKAMMAPRKRVGVNVFYFSTNTSSQHVAQFRADGRACLYFSNTLFVKGVLLKGRAEILDDPVSRELVWKQGDEKYYKLGLTDPDFCVIRFTTESLRYYSNMHSEDAPVVE